MSNSAESQCEFAAIVEKRHALAQRMSSLPILDLTSEGKIPVDLFDDEPATDEFEPETIRLPTPKALDGATLLCQCPECSAPLSVRNWLLTVDCWQCGTSVLLSEAQRQYLRSSQRASESRSDSSRSRIPKSDSKRKPDRRRADSIPDDATSDKSTSDNASPPNAPGKRSRPRVRKRASLRKNVPAWLTSLLMHLALLILLALIGMGQKSEDVSLTLSTQVSKADREGVDAEFIDPVDDAAFDLPVPQSDQPRNERQRRAMVLANQDAKALRMDPNTKHPSLPSLAQLKRAIGSDPDQRTLAVRDPRVRVDMIRREGGTTMTEAAVARGLKWMALHQERDGSWSLHRFHRSAGCGRRCGGHGIIKSDAAATSLCLLPFLGAGQTHFTGIYKDVVSKGLRWLIDQQGEDGDLRGNARGQAGMYAHGQAAIVLCEAYGLTRDEALRKPAQLAIDFIVEAQHGGGGWRYKPGEAGDTSVLGWQWMALQSARVAGLSVPDETVELAGHYLDTVQYQDGALYAYQPRRAPTHVMTAEALLCRMYMGWTLERPALQDGVDILIDEFLPSRREFNIYYWYYGTQVMHHVGGSRWKKWNRRMRDILVESQSQSGHEAGSWPPRGPHGRSGGRLYVTALAICTLEVYYRHAPIFRQINLH